MSSEDRASCQQDGSDMRLYFKLSSFYFFYFALLGGLAPYWGLYLEDTGFNTIEIAQITSVLMVTKILAPNLWGWVGDHTGKRLELVRYGSLFTFVFFLAFYIDNQFWWFISVMAVFSFFWNAVLPQFEVITLHSLGERRERYSRVRLWGSLGFVASVVLLGIIFDHVSISYLPDFLLGIIAFIGLCSLFRFKQPAYSRQRAKGAFLKALASPLVMSFLLINFLLQLSHGPYYTFYSIYMEDLGYDRSTIGVLWAVGVLAEVLLFFIMHRVMQRFSLRDIVLLSLLLTTLRWLMVGVYSEYLVMVVLAQCLHAASFGAMHAVAIHFVHRYFPVNIHGQGQAIYASVSFGAGGALGAIVSGEIVNAYGSPMAFNLAAVCSGLALLIGIFSFKIKSHSA
ncbi:MFS transporter [Alkalimarinus alittae]|uniref:MFS transporter n=1 Tax=Alkalimarinus alittae TaxID=2961619 RepID=A0ABY6N741_9ALTE|nr:MFS transporter [Alkalimarinus alittae]UZE97845.1 MFS transporter [Alkalimarinus alittae]